MTELPEMIPVDSSNLEAVGYVECSEDLHVRFRNGSLYVYRNVPVSTFNELLEADSKGRYLDAHIKKANYPYERLE